jgi:hypothetical protein
VRRSAIMQMECAFPRGPCVIKLKEYDIKRLRARRVIVLAATALARGDEQSPARFFAHREISYLKR